MSGRGSTFLLEIGTEEIPARMIDAALKVLALALQDGLEAGRLLPAVDWTIEKDIKVFGTPRRLAAIVEGLLQAQPDAEAEVTGPPVRMAFDAAGAPTRAAEGFAKSQGVAIKDLIRLATAKGEVLAARRKVPGRAARDVLAEIVPPLVTSLHFPKTMRWGRGEHRFVRPIHSIVALLDSDVVAMAIAGVPSGRETFGHRFTGEPRIALRSPSEYVVALRRSHVIADPAERRDAIRKMLARVAADVPGTISPPPGAGGAGPQGDPELLAEVAHLVESPWVISGTFDADFLRLPAEVLITAMRHHQKYFALRDASGELLNRFLAVADTTGDPSGAIRRGNEWVLRARLADARFFWEEDRKTPLAGRSAMLQRITFHEKLGSFAAKIGRMTGLARALFPGLSASLRVPDFEAVLTALTLCKNDLTTQLVNEFPELEGIVGGLYAEADGQPAEVSQAIRTHYLPRGAADGLPHRPGGVIVSLVDRLDTQAGIFLLGMVPSGSRDPHAMRRSVQGVCRILIDTRISLSLRQAFGLALDGYAGQGIAEAVPRDQALQALLEFYRGRQQFLGEEAGISADAARAALASSCDDPHDARLRMQALDELRRDSGFVDLAAAHKRIKNILKGQTIGSFDPGRLREQAEKALHDGVSSRGQTLRESLVNRDYRAALLEIATLRPQLDRFFKEVMVMAEERPLRENRLALLDTMAALFMKVGDFSELVPEADAKGSVRRAEP